MTNKGRRLKDVKAEQILKRRKARRRKRALFLLAEVLILVMLLAVAYGLVKYGKIDKDIIMDNFNVSSDINDEDDSVEDSLDDTTSEEQKDD